LLCSAWLLKSGNRVLRRTGCSSGYRQAPGRALCRSSTVRGGKVACRREPPGHVRRCGGGCRTGLSYWAGGCCQSGRCCRASGCFWVWLRARWALGAAGNRRDLAVDAHCLVDGLAQIIGVVGPAEGTRQTGSRERKCKNLPVKGPHLGIGFHQRPRAALDFGQCLQDFRPGTAEDLDVAGGPSDAGASGRCSNSCVRRSCGSRFSGWRCRRGWCRRGSSRCWRDRFRRLRCHWRYRNGRCRIRRCRTGHCRRLLALGHGLTAGNRLRRGNRSSGTRRRRLIHWPVRGAHPRRFKGLASSGCHRRLRLGRSRNGCCRNRS
jgi:hypothetical protein